MVAAPATAAAITAPPAAPTPNLTMIRPLSPLPTLVEARSALALIEERRLWANDLSAFLDHWWPADDDELRTVLGALMRMLDRIAQHAVDAIDALERNPTLFRDPEISVHINPARLIEQSARVCGALWVLTRWHTPVYVAIDDYPGSTVDVSD